MAKRPRSGVHQAASAHPPRRGPAAAVPQEPSELVQLRSAHEALQAEAAELRATVAEAEVLLGHNFQRSKVFRKLRRLQEAPFVGPTAAQGPAAMRQVVQKTVAAALDRLLCSRSGEAVDRSAVLLEEEVVSHDVIPSLVFEYVVAPFVENDTLLLGFDNRPPTGFKPTEDVCFLLPGYTSLACKCEILRAMCPDNVLSSEETAVSKVVNACYPPRFDPSRFTKTVVVPVLESTERDEIMDEALAMFLFRYSRPSRFVDDSTGKTHPFAATLMDLLETKVAALVSGAPAAPRRLTLAVAVTMIEQMACANDRWVRPSPLRPIRVKDLLVDVFGTESADLSVRVSLIRIFRAVIFDQATEDRECFQTETFRDEFLLPAAQLELPEDVAVDLLDGLFDVGDESRYDLKDMYCTEVMRDHFCIPLAACVSSDHMAYSLLLVFGGLFDEYNFDCDDADVIAEHPGVIFATPTFRDHFFARIASMIDDSETAFRFIWSLALVLRLASRTTPHPFITDDFRTVVDPVLQIARRAECNETEDEDAFICSVLGIRSSTAFARTEVEHVGSAQR